MRVLTRVGDLFRGERAMSPVGALHLLIERNAKPFLQDVSETDVSPTQNPRRDHRIEKILESKLIIPLHAEDVILGRMENLFGLSVSENWTQR